MDSGSDTGFDSTFSAEEDVEEDTESEEEVPTEENNKRKKKERKKSTKKQKVSKNERRPPTVEELNRLRETENLFHSNLFRLQIEEMIKQIQIKEKNKKYFESWLTDFKRILNKIEEKSEIYSVNDQKWLKNINIKMPIKQDPYNVKGHYQFLKPADVFVSGSYFLNTNLGPNTTVNINVRLPKSFFQKDDFLNNVYHRKRALYMCELAAHLKNFEDVVSDINFISLDDVLKPQLEIIPTGKTGKHFIIHLNVIPAADSFKLNRFHPAKNNIRPKWFFNDQSVEEMPPTPQYNCSIVQDLSIDSNMSHLQSLLTSYPNLREGVLLLKVWLKQRELDIGIGGFNGFVAFMLVAYLVMIKKINAYMSSYQIVRNVWNFIAATDWMANGITLCQITSDPNLPLISEYHQHYEVVFVDTTGYNNLCAYLPTPTYERLRYEAKQSMLFLDNPNINSFQMLFMTYVPFYRSYDHIILFHDRDALELSVEINSKKDSKLDTLNNRYNQARGLIYNLLKQGLGDRVVQIHIKQTKTTKWSLDKKPKQKEDLIFGLNINPENGLNMVIKGPEANLTEAEEFRAFWGEKSELRRFQDGSITEAVVWACTTLSNKRLITKEIVKYLLNLKLNLQENSLTYLADQFECVISRCIGSSMFEYGTGEEATLLILDAFNQVSKKLRNLQDLPLAIVNVQGSSPAFRYTEVYPPLPYSSRKQSVLTKEYCTILAEEASTQPPTYIVPLDIVIQLAASKKWPYDLQAIRRIKAAFCIKIAELLRKDCDLTAQAFTDSIQVFINGYIFKFNIVYPNEIGLMKRIEEPGGLVKYKDTKESLAVEKKFMHLPVLTGVLHGVYQQYPSYGPACCLAKRWINAHMLDAHHVPEEVIELLMCSVYLKPEPYQSPNQPQVAFIRFLNLLATTNWNSEPLILNFNNELNRQDMLEIESNFNTNRSVLPPLFIATPNDHTDSIWTKQAPTALILVRLIELARKALNLIEVGAYSPSFVDTKVLFTPFLEAYDILIYVNSNVVARQNQQCFTSSTIQLEPYEKKKKEILPVVGFDPVFCYLTELRNTFDEFALFFHDSYGGDVIGVVWKPVCLESKDFKVSHVNCRKYDSGTKQLIFNYDSILEDFFCIGRGLVKKIEKKVNGVFKQVSKS